MYMCACVQYYNMYIYYVYMVRTPHITKLDLFAFKEKLDGTLGSPTTLAALSN